ncbi:DUF1611 domain-containing protein [Paenibacillus herberti]|uniref:D-glutamate N-acetyltransferase-like C-terminal domain-containing protein n=1 Tax=Paenibacillus herberti TaxID=1619309 RepID=A0A229P1X6_9BACL|nr:DUF1611 domain-containing protein [Paenibacillus herberti]OXM15895.1 hypothetical protein CGZ75_04055 [Paenibacillus herberti]
MNKIALYPFNKISQGLIRFRDLLSMEIVSVIDFVFEAGKDAGELVDGAYAGIGIHRLMEVGLAGVDTLVLNDPGTTFGGNKGVFDEHDLVGMWRKLVSLAKEKGIRLVSVHEIYDKATLEWLSDNGIHIEVHGTMSEELFRVMDERYAFGGTDIENYLQQFENEHRMFSRSRRIRTVGVFATRGCLGKFTSQMGLYREFHNSGVRSTAFITEPTGSLFGQPEGDIFKFLAHRPLEQYPYYIDTVVSEAEREGKDWIIMSAQSSILPTDNIAFNSLRFAMLKAFRPAYSLLIVGYGDDGQIRDALDMLRIYSAAPVALLLPDKMETSYGKYETFSEDQRELRLAELQERFGIHAARIEHSKEIMNLLLEKATIAAVVE